MKLSLCRKIYRRGQEVRTDEMLDYMRRMYLVDEQQQRGLDKVIEVLHKNYHGKKEKGSK